MSTHSSERSASAEKKGVILMTYGSATTSAGVRPYMDSIYRGSAPESVVDDFSSRYDQIGSSPLIDITREQARSLEEKLGEEYIVRAGMRHLEPSILAAVQECAAAGAVSMLGVVLSPQISQAIREAYAKQFIAACEQVGLSSERVDMAVSWPTEPAFVELLAHRTNEMLTQLQRTNPTPIPVIFTTHSMPKRIVESDAQYMNELQATIDAVRKKITYTGPWYAAYQSAGHAPEPWLTPDVTDVLKEVATQGTKAVIIVPIQFLADHLEVLYDLDIALRKQCEEHYVEYHRIGLPNTDPLFIESLARTVADASTSAARA